MTTFSKTLGIGIIIGIIIFLVFWVIESLSGATIIYDRDFLINFGYHQIYSIILSFANVYYFEYLNTRVVWNKYKKYRLLIGALGGVIVTMISIFFIRVLINIGIQNESFVEFLEGEKMIYYVMSLLITVIISIFFHAFYFYRELQKNKVKEQKIIAGTASAQFDALKNQLDPHFLFNSLNVLTSLIDENPDNAQRFTTALSKVYRYVLEQKNKELVSVDEELQFARTYISLLKMRFEDSIIFEIPEKAKDPGAKVVPLSLQLLLENAVKHNVVNDNHPLKIKIFESGGNLIIENNLQIKKILKKSSGVGLTNIKQRYQLLTDKQVNISKTEDSFRVAIPMLTKQISIMETRDESVLNDNYVRARKHVENLKEFYYSLISYVIVIPFLIFIWYRFTPNVIQWFWFPMFGWGIGLLFHAYKVYVNDGVLGRNWEQKKIEEFMQDEKQNRWS